VTIRSDSPAPSKRRVGNLTPGAGCRLLVEAEGMMNALGTDEPTGSE
jgi:hypothetical protein